MFISISSSASTRYKLRAMLRRGGCQPCEIAGAEGSSASFSGAGKSAVGAGIAPNRTGNIDSNVRDDVYRRSTLCLQQSIDLSNGENLLLAAREHRSCGR